MGRAPYGARGLKFFRIPPVLLASGRAPYGARGLKYLLSVTYRTNGMSRPVWGAWIEMGIMSLPDTSA